MAIEDNTDLPTSEEGVETGLLLARLPLDTRVRRQPQSVEELPRELIESIHNPAVLENGVPYVNTAWASTELVDSYSTRMRPSSLQNYAQNARDGIALQNSHRTNELPLGRTYDGRYKGQRAHSTGNPSRTEMDFFIPPGLNISGINTSDVIKAIDYGSVRDVSIGFYGGDLICSLDGKRMMGDILALLFGGADDDAEIRDPAAPCNHLPGMEYSVRDKDGKKTDQRAVAVGEVEGANCAELSLVFDGATPMATISGRAAPVFAKAYRLAEMEILPKEAALFLEARYRGVRFPTITTPRFYLGSRKEWDTAYVNDLPDSAFALVYTDENGNKVRKLPHHSKGGKVDLPHLRNALARAPQMTGVSDAQRSKAISHLKKHARSEGVGEDSREQHEIDEDDTFLVEETQNSEETRAMAEPNESNSTPDEDEETPQPVPTNGTSLTVPNGTNGMWVTTTTASNGTTISSAGLADAERTISNLRSALVTAGLAPEGFAGDLAVRFTELGREVGDLRIWADIGHQAREQLVEDCKKAGVRAFGKQWSESAYTDLFTRGSYTNLQSLYNHWTEVGNSRFQGGRMTQDGVDPPPSTPTDVVKVPARAYRA